MLTIKTNNQPRPVLGWHDLTEAENKEFDYLGDDVETASFFRYKGHVYELGEFMFTSGELAVGGWSGYLSDTFFSGVVVKFKSHLDEIIVGRFYS